MRCFSTAVLVLVFSLPGFARAEITPEYVAASTALRRAVKFYQEKVSIQGGYLWRYSPDLQAREGEGRASRTTAWVQPPGTPSVGNALLEAYHRTGQKYLLDAAVRSGRALVAGQLQSGGWYYSIEFDKQKRQRYAYRLDGNTTGRNVTTLDDNTTQSALRFLMRLDQTLKFKDEQIHDCVRCAKCARAGVPRWRAGASGWGGNFRI